MDTKIELESEAKVRVILPEIMLGVIESEAEYFCMLVAQKSGLTIPEID